MADHPHVLLISSSADQLEGGQMLQWDCAELRETHLRKERF